MVLPMVSEHFHDIKDKNKDDECKKSGIARMWWQWQIDLSELLLDIEKTTDETQICHPHIEDKAKKSKEAFFSTIYDGHKGNWGIGL